MATGGGTTGGRCLMIITVTISAATVMTTTRAMRFVRSTGESYFATTAERALLNLLLRALEVVDRPNTKQAGQLIKCGSGLA